MGNTEYGERGVQLSEGKNKESQLLEHLSKPDNITFRHATSALDVQSEHMFQEALDQIMVGRTTVVVGTSTKHN
ncbi:hypothetical protein R6Q59_024925 [Mikania micrantha]